MFSGVENMALVPYILKSITRLVLVNTQDSRGTISLDLVLSLRVNEHGPPTIDLRERQTSMLAVLFTVPDCFSGVTIIQFIHRSKTATFKNLIS